MSTSSDCLYTKSNVWALADAGRRMVYFVAKAEGGELEYYTVQAVPGLAQLTYALFITNSHPPVLFTRLFCTATLTQCVTMLVYTKPIMRA